MTTATENRAFVSLKLKPHEYDLVRRALSSYQSEQYRINTDKDTTAKERADARAEATLTAALIRVIG